MEADQSRNQTGLTHPPNSHPYYVQPNHPQVPYYTQAGFLGYLDTVFPVVATTARRSWSDGAVMGYRGRSRRRTHHSAPLVERRSRNGIERGRSRRRAHHSAPLVE
jgi:hypothetical protein